MPIRQVKGSAPLAGGLDKQAKVFQQVDPMRTLASNLCSHRLGTIHPGDGILVAPWGDRDFQSARSRLASGGLWNLPRHGYLSDTGLLPGKMLSGIHAQEEITTARQ